MIDLELLSARMSKLNARDLERWILNTWVRPETDDGRYLFCEIDVARVRLIQELSDDLQVSEEALPIVLLLLDQLYDTRRRIREVGDALAAIAPEDLQRRLLEQLAKPIAERF